MVRAVDGPAGFDELLADSRRNALILGPGAGVSDAVRQQVLMALATRRGVVLDADALTVFGNDAPVLFNAINGPCVLTPHEGEFLRLFSSEGDKLQQARAAARSEEHTSELQSLMRISYAV